MQLAFFKYEGAGNDFILIDDRSLEFPSSDVLKINKLCDRRFGIGADGLMLVQPEEGYDFRMIYYNADGKESTMCGNGGRCIAAFANRLGIAGKVVSFIAIDGPHEAHIGENGIVRLKMSDVDRVDDDGNAYFLNTGSPHYVQFIPSLAGYNVYAEGKKIRYSKTYEEEGTNVNFVEDQGDRLFVRTYERGVENETLACGTGVVASAICAFLRKGTGKSQFSTTVTVPGGQLRVSGVLTGDAFTDLWLEGPATFVFKGNIEL